MLFKINYETRQTSLFISSKFQSNFRIVDKPVRGYRIDELLFRDGAAGISLIEIDPISYLSDWSTNIIGK